MSIKDDAEWLIAKYRKTHTPTQEHYDRLMRVHLKYPDRVPNAFPINSFEDGVSGPDGKTWEKWDAIYRQFLACLRVVCELEDGNGNAPVDEPASRKPKKSQQEKTAEAAGWLKKFPGLRDAPREVWAKLLDIHPTNVSKSEFYRTIQAGNIDDLKADPDAAEEYDFGVE